MRRSNKIIADACKHIVNVFEADGTHLDYGEVLNKFEHFTMNESLVNKNKKTLDRIYCKCISNHKLMEFVVTQLYGKLNEGFYNPFNDEGQEDEDIFDDEYITVDDKADVRDEDGKKQEEILVNDQCINGKIMIKDGRMYSGVNMRRGDVVEICPIVPLDKVSMCARPVRDLAFQISAEDPDLYGIPFGYANFYRTTDMTGTKGNVDYEYPEQGDFMKIIAIEDIQPNEELVLRVDEDPNTIAPNTIQEHGYEELINEGVKDFAKKAVLGIGLGAATLFGGNSTASATMSDDSIKKFATDYAVMYDASNASKHEKEQLKQGCYNLADELYFSDYECYSGVGVSEVSPLQARAKAYNNAVSYYYKQTGKTCSVDKVGIKYLTRNVTIKGKSRYSCMVILMDMNAKK